MKTTLMIGASALAFSLATPGVALANQECGLPDAAQNPNVANCLNEPSNWANGITYDQGDYATPAGIKVDLWATAVVAPTTNDTAVTVIGSPDQAAVISARGGSTITAIGTGLSAQTTGTGAAIVESHGNVVAGNRGLLATTDLAGGTGLASVINQSGGTVTLTLPAALAQSAALFARGGSASATNNGTVSLSSLAPVGGLVYGIAGESHAADGTVTLANANSVTLTGLDTDFIGVGTTESSGQVDISNTGSIAIATAAGDATGLHVAGAGTPGAVTLANSGLLSVSTDIAVGSGHAIGMDVQQGTSATLISARTGATGGMTVSGGGAATGFLVENVSGPVSVRNTGYVLDVASGGLATGVQLSGGSSQAVRFEDTVIGGNIYNGDLVVQGAGSARGIVLDGATDTVSVDFDGASLLVTSTGADASGIVTQGGADVAITTAAKVQNGNGAAITVSAADGTAAGITIAGATGAQAVALGDAITVTNIGGSAVGLSLADGTSQSVSLANGATVAGMGATGAQFTGASGSIELTSAAGFTVEGGTGGATGVILENGADQTANFAGNFSVNADDGDVKGVTSSGAGGAVSVNAQQGFNVTNGGGLAAGIIVTDGTSQTVLMADGLSVTGTSATGAQLTNGSGAVSFTANGPVAVDGGVGGATGIVLADGFDQTTHLAGDLAVDASGGVATGLISTGAAGAVELNAQGAFAVTNRDGSATGLILADGTSQAATLSEGLGVAGTGAIGVILTGSAGAATFTANGAVAVDGGTGGAMGVLLADGIDQTVTFAGDVAVDASGGIATGVLSTGASGAVGIAAQNGFSVSNAGGAATGLTLAGGASQTVTLGNGLSVVGVGATGAQLVGATGAVTLASTNAVAVDGGTSGATGVILAGGSDQTIDLNGDLAVRASAGTTTGLILTSASGAMEVNANDAFSVTSGDGPAAGLILSGGTSQAVVLGEGLHVAGAGGAGAQMSGALGSVDLASTGDFTVEGGADQAVGVVARDGTTQSLSFEQAVRVNGLGATGIDLAGGSGALSVALGDALTVVGGAAGATGISLADGTAQTIDLAGPAIIQSSGGVATGVQSTGAAGNIGIVSRDALAVTNSAGSAVAIDIDGGTGADIALAGPVTVTASGDTSGVQIAGAGSLDLISATDFTVTSGEGDATGAAVTGGASQSATFGGPVAITGAERAVGLSQTGASGAIVASFEGPLTVAGGSGLTAGIVQTNGTTQTVSLSDTMSVSSVDGPALGILLEDGAGVATAHLPSMLTATSLESDAFGLVATNGQGLVIDGEGTVTAIAGGTARGIASVDQSGAQTVQIGDVTATSTGGMASGVLLGGFDAISVRSEGTITVSAIAGGVGVGIDTSGSDAAIDVVLNDIAVTGDNVTGISLNQTGGAGSSGTIAASVNAVTTNGANAIGMSATGSQSGAVALTLGQASADDHSGGVTTAGDGATGVQMTVTDGPGSITNLGRVATSGEAANGIGAVATGNGAISVDSWTLVTTGAGSDGIAVTTGAGAQTIKAHAVSVSGAGASGIAAKSAAGAIAIETGTLEALDGAGHAIVASSDIGAISVTSVNSSAQSADAIHLSSVSGDVAVTLVDGGRTSSANGAGLFVDTGGHATINLGTETNNAILHGSTVGLSSHATDGQTITLSGVLGADSDLALSLTGGSATLLNNGAINGYVSLGTSSIAFTNAGIWNGFGGNSAFTANSTFTNNGTFNVNPGAAGPATMLLTGLGTFRNAGTVSLVNGQAGDLLDLGGAAFAGSGGSRVILEANLGGAAIGAIAAQTADQLSMGAASGVTTIVINDLSGAAAAQFNFSGIRIVSSTSAEDGAFILQGGSINKGFAEYQLVGDGNGNFNLVSVPSVQAFELVRTGAEVRRYWRRSGDAWAEQMRASKGREGLSAWGQFYGGGETNEARPVYSLTVLDRPMSFTPNLDIRDSWTGAQLGFDWGQGDWSVGLTGGYVGQQGRVKATGDEIKLDGANIGAYFRYRSASGFFAHVLAKLDRFSVKYDLQGAASARKFDGTSYGIQAEAGYRLDMGRAFIEPAVSIAWSHSDLDGIKGAAGGFDASFHNVGSAYGRAGARAGIAAMAGGWAISPYVGLAFEGELKDQPGMTLVSGGNAVSFQDVSEGGRARLEAGVEGSGHNGLSAFAKIEGITGKHANGLAGRVGVAFRW
ncbi:hypothetical protein [Sphingobium sp. TKS]|uniref:hypothetical protein n=1 Tax=Sphingobium sp. TKS TaxID=1315974 RepID=UPI00077024DC|nr:hypothetical protein [Sphingobium sp. TKS]AMK26238.1 outer membrane autotransporter barrel domain-containing protein [Sphingobium sp. TKS]